MTISIATWNVNSVKARMIHLLDWLKSGKPDIVLLQETKCTDDTFPALEIEDLGYNLAFHGDFMPVTKKHTKHLDIIDVVNGAVDKAQRHFEPMKVRIDAWRDFSLSDMRAKEVIYNAFIVGDLDAPKHMAARVHGHYFNPPYVEFEPRTMWSLSNAFTEAFKALDPIPQFKATAALGKYLAAVH